MKKTQLTHLEVFRYLESRAKSSSAPKERSLMLLACEVHRHPQIAYAIRPTKYGYNLGDISECLVLGLLGLKVEDNQHEIKSFILNHWNTLTDTSRKTCYILNTYSKNTGLYKCDASLIRNKTITNKVSLEKLLRKCTLLNRI